MSEQVKSTNPANWKDGNDAVVPDLEDVLDPLEATDDYPVPNPDDDEPLDDDELLDEEIEGSFPASDPPSSTPTTSLGGPAHEKD
jgi:hypothetical protein